MQSSFHETAGGNSNTGTARAWCFTLNNPVMDDSTSLETLAVEETRVKTILYGRETGESGTPHFQGIIILTVPTRMAWLRQRFIDFGISSVHWSKCRNRPAAIKYCKKDGDWELLGEQLNSRQGRRTDLQDACTSLLESRNLLLFKEEYPEIYVKYHKGFEKLLHDDCLGNRIPPDITWIYGPTGTGKTRYVFDRESLDHLWLASVDLKWFDGYNGQPAVLIDDFRGNFCSFHSLLRYLDRYPMRVPVKGGFVVWKPERIYITSSKHPSAIYNVDEDVNQLLRRITRIRYTGEAHVTDLGLPNPQTL